MGTSAIVRFLIATIVLISSAWLLAQSQSPDSAPIFRASTDLVQVDVSVLDNRRQPVRDLTADDFTILEDGQPRPVETFTFVDLPARVSASEAAWMTEVPADVATNRVLTQEGRLVVILMDRSIPAGLPTVTAREVATAAVNELGPGDMAAVVSTSGGVPQNFTSDRSRLIRAINQRDWSTGSSGEHAELLNDVGLVAGQFTNLTDGRCLCGLCVPETITNVATALQDVPRRRKSLLFIGSGVTWQAGPATQQSEMGCGLKLEDARKDMFAALDRSGVTVHTIDPLGLDVPGPMSQASSSRRGVRVQQDQFDTINSRLRTQGELFMLPDRTGGRVVANTNGPQAQIPAIVRESASYYLLGFRPSEADTARATRTIEVKVNRRNVDVRSRREFSTVAAATSGTSDVDNSAARALGGLLPETRLPLNVHLSTFAGRESSRASVIASVDLDAFAPPRGASAQRTPLDIVIGAYDATGRPRASATQHVELQWPATDAASAVIRTEALTQLSLDPGDYEIRVAVTNPVSLDSSSVFSHITVPAFTSLPLALSSIVVDAPRATRSVLKEHLGEVLPVAPTTSRLFSRADGPVAAFFRIYQGTQRNASLEDASVRVRIIDAEGRTVRDEGLVLAASDFGTERSADCRIGLPVPQLPAGEYLLRLEAAVGDRLAGRVMRFAVE
jgi:VWFA-related protein